LQAGGPIRGLLAVNEPPDLALAPSPHTEAAVGQFPLNDPVDLSCGDSLTLELAMSPSNVLLYRFRPVVMELRRQLVEVSLRYVRDPQEVLAETGIQSRNGHRKDSIRGLDWGDFVRSATIIPEIG